MGRLHADRLALSLLAACLPTTAPAGPPSPTATAPAPVVPIEAVPATPPPPAPTAAPQPPPRPAEPPREALPPLVDAGSLDGFPDYQVAPWWTPPPRPPHNPMMDIVRAMPGFRKSLRQCYASSLKSDPNMHGQVAVEFTVGPRGRVVAVVTAQNSSLHGLARCIRAKLQQLSFPPQDPPVTVSFPILFVPADRTP